MKRKDTVEKDGKWEFDEEVTESFDDMLERSIPQYSVMREAVTDLGSKVLQSQNSAKTPFVVDLGTSRGRAVEGLVRRFGANARFLLCELSDPMIEAARKQYADMIDAGVVRVEKRDLRSQFPTELPTSLFLSVLTLQFIPVNYRQQIVHQVHDALLHDGAFILVEKVFGEGPVIDERMIEVYTSRKHAAGYSYESIDRKRESLEGRSRPCHGTPKPGTARTSRISICRLLLALDEFCRLDCGQVRVPPTAKKPPAVGIAKRSTNPASRRSSCNSPIVLCFPPSFLIVTLKRAVLSGPSLLSFHTNS